MARQLTTQPIGNQSFRDNYGNNFYEYHFIFNERLQRFFIDILNLTTNTSVIGQSLEPLSNLNIEGLGYGTDIILIPFLTAPVYGIYGNFKIVYTDLGAGLFLLIGSKEEFESLGTLNGTITIFP